MKNNPTELSKLLSSIGGFFKAIHNSLPDVSPLPVDPKQPGFKILVHGVVVSIKTGKPEKEDEEEDAMAGAHKQLNPSPISA
ncbi:hypothetical protein [Pelagicoccus albus]|uniref:Uncharacterized protein n=1 Tax=Pelagicoccus albus TaxID=415222 RepID=A0A7X1B7Y9_9BACT|nr:hypothetical protein [Pelagicoccus albus]MBC2607349.1 hypothetical protein [Pelagicoccus albus]